MGSARTFRLGPARLVISQGDITQQEVDAIVNAANERMLGGGGVDGAIHRAAGHQLVRACAEVPEVSPGCRCPTGEARITPGFQLPARHVIHTVGPIYEGDTVSQPLLTSAYRSSMALALQHGLASIAFPAISCGIFGYPAAKGAQVALSTVRDALLEAAAAEAPAAAGPAAAEGPGAAEAGAAQGEAGAGEGAQGGEGPGGEAQGGGAGAGGGACSIKEVRFLLFGDPLYNAFVAAAEELVGQAQ